MGEIMPKMKTKAGPQSASKRAASSFRSNAPMAFQRHILTGRQNKRHLRGTAEIHSTQHGQATFGASGATRKGAPHARSNVV